MTRKKFKNLDHCEKHNQYYHWSYGCSHCKKEKAKNMKSIDEVMKKMEDDGLIPQTRLSDER